MILKKIPLRLIIISVLVAAVAVSGFLVMKKLMNKPDPNADPRGDDTRGYPEKVADFEKQNPTLKKGQIVFLGDSSTERYEVGRHFRSLDLDCYNRSISGDTIGWAYTRMYSCVFAIAPSKLVITLGMNDVNGKKTTEQIYADYDRLLRLISENLPDCMVYCVSITPQNTEYSDKAHENNLRTKEANAAIATLASAYGYKYVNTYDALTDKNGLLAKKYTYDGLHPSKKGYRIWTKVIKAALED